MIKNDQSQVSEGKAARICWGEGQSCSGSVWTRPTGVFHFVLEAGQSLDGCPPGEAVLEVSGHFGLSDRYKILGFESSLPNACNFRADKLSDPPEPCG
jgi:hypothetical protein